MKVAKTPLPGVVLVTPTVHRDPRGFFLETYNQAAFTQIGLPPHFLQDNHSHSAQGVLRGLHYQYPHWQGKLVRVLRGEIFDVAVDIRRDSPHYAQWFGVTLSADNPQQIYIPPGYAHGFCVLSEYADVTYKCTTLYAAKQAAAILWNDPDIGIEWPIESPRLSAKDAAAPRLSATDIR